MGMLRRLWLAAVIGLGALSAHAVTCPAGGITISPGTSLTQTIEAASAGQTICLNPGTYLPNSTPTPGGYGVFGNFGIAKNNITIIGLGSTPAGVVLQSSASGDYAVHFAAYNAQPSPNGTTLQNLTITGSDGGVILQDTSRLHDITLKDVVVNTTTTSAGPVGVLMFNDDRIVLDNVTINSHIVALDMINVTTSLIMNSDIVQSPASGGVSVLGGSGNIFVNNTIGSPAVGSSRSFASDAVVFYNSIANRFELNTVQGQTNNGVIFDAVDGAGYGITTNASGISSDNYAGKNTVISTDFANGRPLGSSGIWSNCSSNNTWLFGNDTHGVSEAGIYVYTSTSNMLLGNSSYDNGIAGFVNSGGMETRTTQFCYTPTYQLTPQDNYVLSNSFYFNKNDQMVVRSSNNITVARNYLSPHSTFAGPVQTCPTTDCQSDFSFETDSALASSGGHRVLLNTSQDNHRGIWGPSTNPTSLAEFSGNRILNSSLNLFTRSTPMSLDGGATVGGNFWTQATANGNPSTGGTPYGGVFDSSSSTTGKVIDHYPYQTEGLGRGDVPIVSEPFTNESFAQGARRTVRWTALGCALADVSLDGTTDLATNVGNTGYAVVTIPVSATVGSHTMVVRCKDSNGVVRATGSSGAFNVSASSLQLMSPGRDDVINADGTTAFWVGWKQDATITSVAVDYSTNGGSSWTTLQSGLTGTTYRATLPAGASSAYGMVRVRSGTTIDTTDGVFAIRGSSGYGFTSANFTAGRKFSMGQVERLEWASPPNSRLVDIIATVGGGAPVTVATHVPDRGNFDWIPQDLGTGSLSLQINFLTTSGGFISSATSLAGSLLKLNTITMSALATMQPGATQGVSATSNSGLAVSIASLTTGVCTVSGGTITGVAQGTCTIAANQSGNSTYAPAAQVQASFLVSTDPPRLGNISTRMAVLTGNNVMIAGFIIGGSTNKTLAITATGPSLAAFGISNFLANPSLRIVRSSDQTTIATNDDWQTDANAGLLQASGFAPGNSKEAGLYISLPPGAYTAIVSGVGSTTGVSVVGVFEVDHPEIPLVNISTRGFVQTGSNVMIGGFIVNGSGPQTVAITATGPSLAPFGISNFLANPQIQLVRSSDQAVLATNDDWQSDVNAAQLQASGFAPSNSKEPGLFRTLDPGAYTVIVSGVGGTTGVALVGVFTSP